MEDRGVNAAAARERVMARPSLDQVVEGRAYDSIIPPVSIDQGDVDQPRCTEIEKIVEGCAGHHIVAAAAIDLLDRLADRQSPQLESGVTIVTEDQVIAVAAINEVLAVGSPGNHKSIISGAAEQFIVPWSAVDQVIEGRAEDRIVALQGIDLIGLQRRAHIESVV
jgi:hypothetical protein